MANITAKQIQAFVKGEPKRHPIGSGLYLVVRNSATPYWMLRYSSNGKRKEITLEGDRTIPPWQPLHDTRF